MMNVIKMKDKFGIGLLSSGNNIFSGQYLSTIASINKNINQSTDMLVYIAASSVSPVIVRLSVLNLTDRSYNGNGYAGSDNIRFSIAYTPKGDKLFM